MYLYSFISGGLQKVVLQSQSSVIKGRVIAKSEKVLNKYLESHKLPKRGLEEVFEINLRTSEKKALGLRMDKGDLIAYKDYNKRNNSVKEETIKVQ